jgi:hypothetical protein
MRKTLHKIAALSVCVGFLLIAVPNANAAAIEKKGPKFNFMKKPVMFINAIIPFFADLFDSGDKSIDKDENKTAKKIKITGTLPSRKPSGGD